MAAEFSLPVCIDTSSIGPDLAAELRRIADAIDPQPEQKRPKVMVACPVCGEHLQEVIDCDLHGMIPLTDTGCVEVTSPAGIGRHFWEKHQNDPTVEEGRLQLLDAHTAWADRIRGA